MGKKPRGNPELPPDVLNELVTRIEQLEQNQIAIEGAIQAFITVFAVRRLPDRTGDGDHS